MKDWCSVFPHTNTLISGLSRAYPRESLQRARKNWGHKSVEVDSLSLPPVWRLRLFKLWLAYAPLEGTLFNFPQVPQ